MERCIICLGSNTDGKSHLFRARKSIDSIFPNIRWGEIIVTEAEGTKCPLPYCNQAAIFDTEMDITQIKSIFKSLEQNHGRTASSKSSGIIPLDIDLLVYGKVILKPNDLEKNYVKRTLDSIK